ncbi:hypothetical protein PFISCL1PPCAC_10237, partial [Pristionchus fissidentatus]
ESFLSSSLLFSFSIHFPPMSERKSAVSPISRPPTPPIRFTETIPLKVKKGARLAINVRQSDNCVTRILEGSPLFHRINIGDRIIGVNGKSIDLKRLQEFLEKNGDAEFLVKLEHMTFSWSWLRKTTLECIATDKENEVKVIGRAINVYKVVLHDFTPSEIRSPLGLQIRYDARERIEIYHVAPKSICATHLRSGDIIREINGRTVCSKSMCQAWMQQSLCATKKVALTIETPVNGHDSYREQEEMPEEVIQIAKKQIDFLKRGGASRLTPKGISAVRSSSSTTMIDVFKKTESPKIARSPGREQRVITSTVVNQISNSPVVIIYRNPLTFFPSQVINTFFYRFRCRPRRDWSSNIMQTWIQTRSKTARISNDWVEIHESIDT